MREAPTHTIAEGQTPAWVDLADCSLHLLANRTPQCHQHMEANERVCHLEVLAMPLPAAKDLRRRGSLLCSLGAERDSGEVREVWYMPEGADFGEGSGRRIGREGGIG